MRTKVRQNADKVMTKAKTSESTYPYLGAHNVLNMLNDCTKCGHLALSTELSDGMHFADMTDTEVTEASLLYVFGYLMRTTMRLFISTIFYNTIISLQQCNLCKDFGFPTDA